MVRITIQQRLSRLAQHASQPPKNVTYADAIGACSLLDYAVALFQPLGRGAENAIRNALGGVAVLFDFVDAVCEEIDVWFEGMAECGEMCVQSRRGRECECGGGGGRLVCG